MFCVSFVISSSLWPKKRLLGFRSCDCGIYFVYLMCGAFPLALKVMCIFWASPFVFPNYDLKVEICEMETRSG